ncbi:glycosyltransferase family protein [Paenibacillus auburnensis]|nr:glycosyltransferase [Paenibacillus auburnensis]
MNIPQPEARRELPSISGFVDHKQIRILMVSSLTGESMWQVEQMIAEQFRLLAKELVSIKAFQSFSSALVQLNPDLLLVVGNEESFSGTDLEIIRKAPLKKAIWLSDGSFTSESTARLAALFDYVFTQNTLHIPFYQHSGCKNVRYLPFAADRSLFSPRSVNAEYKSYLLLLGDARGAGKEYAEKIKHLFTIKKVAAAGIGWEEYPGLKVLAPDTELQDYYNGAELVIHWGGPAAKFFDIAACGVFQLAEGHPNIYEYMNPGEDIVIFHTADELLEKLHYYSSHADAKRAIASRALWKSTYDYSFLQMASKLLHTIFNYS